MSATIEDLVESLAQSLQRSVTVDDGDLRLLAYSRHFEEVDPARMDALVGRGATGDVREYIVGQRIRSWVSPTRLPASREHGFYHDRIGFPLRSRYELLGFMWIIDNRRLSDDEMQTALQVAEELTRLLERRVQSQRENTEEEALVIALLSAEEPKRLEAARELRGLGVLSATPRVVAVTVTIPGLPEATVADLLRPALSRAILNRNRSSAAFAVRGADGVLLVGALVNEAQNQTMTLNLAERVRVEIAKLNPELPDRVRIGIGGPSELAEAVVSYRQAWTGVRIGQREGRGVVAWENYPLEGLLDAVLRTEVDERLVPPLFTTVLADQPAETISFVKCFLDHAGNAVETANALYLNRATVYYRLRRFTENTGLDLEDGRVRLMVHLWLTLKEQRQPAGPS